MKRRSHFASKQRKSVNGSFISKPKKIKLANDDIKQEFSLKNELLKDLKPVYVTITKLSKDELEKYQANSDGQLNRSIIENVDLNSSSKLFNQRSKSKQKLNNMENTQNEAINFSSEDEQVTIQIVPSSKVIKDISGFKKMSINGNDDVNVISLPNSNLNQTNDITDKLDKISKNAITLRDVSERKYKEDEGIKYAENIEDVEENEGDKNEGGSDDEAIGETADEQIVDISNLEQQVNLDKKWSTSLTPKTFFCIFCSRKTIVGFEKARIHYQHHLDCYLYKCSLCLEVLTDIGSLYRHYRKLHYSKKKATFIKQKSDYTLDWINTFLESQIQVTTPKLGYKQHCPVCQACERQEDIVDAPINSINLKLLYSHIFKHLHYEPFVCTFCEKCEKKFTAHLINTNAYEHVLSDHPEHADTSLENIFRQTNIRYLDLFVKTFLSNFGINFSFKSPKTIPNFFKNRFFEKIQSQKQNQEANKPNLFKSKELESLHSLPLNQVSPNVTLIQNISHSTPLHYSQTDPSQLNNLLLEHSNSTEQGFSPDLKVVYQKTHNGIVRSSLTSHQPQKAITCTKSQTTLNINTHAFSQSHLPHVPLIFNSTRSFEPLTNYLQFDKAGLQEAEAIPINTNNSSLASYSNLRQTCGLSNTSQVFTKLSNLSQTLIKYQNHIKQSATSDLYLPDLITVQPDLPDLQILNEVTHHKTESYFCVFCNNQVVFSNRIDASFHFARHLNYKPLVCLLCSQKFVDFDTLMSHFLTHHDHQRVCKNETCDNLLYYARQDAKIEQWIDEYLYFQTSGKVHELWSSQYQSFCLICAKFSKQSCYIQPHINNLDFIFEHVNTHFNYHPFRCMLCKNKNENIGVPWLGTLAQNHLISHGYSNMSKSLLPMFFFYEPITKLEILIKDYLLTKYCNITTPISSGYDTTNESSFISSTSTLDRSIQEPNIFFTKTKTKFKKMPKFNFNSTDGQDKLACYHCNRVLPTKKHLRDHHLAFHPNLSLVAYPIRFPKVS